MKGAYHIVIQSKNLKYEFDIKRNITIIKGDSATGKTTLIELIREYGQEGEESGIQLSCKAECVVIEGQKWKDQLSAVKDSIVFIDETNKFIETQEFASAVKESTNYFVIITRESLEMLPVSVNEVYGIKSSGKYSSLAPVYHELYEIYESSFYSEPCSVCPNKIIVEDSNSGYDFFSHLSESNNVECISANGKSNIFDLIIHSDKEENILIIADGAAFASQMNRIIRLVKNNKNYHLYLPESFEWMILKSGVIKDSEISEILSSPYEYVLSEKWFSWERFFTDLLVYKTGEGYLKYSKKKLNSNYLHHNIFKKILSLVDINGIMLYDEN